MVHKFYNRTVPLKVEFSQFEKVDSELINHMSIKILGSIS